MYISGLVPNQHPISFFRFRPETNTETVLLIQKLYKIKDIQVLQHFLNKDTVPKTTNDQIHQNQSFGFAKKTFSTKTDF